MKYLVTGGAGFIGSHLIDRLILANHDVICIDDLSSGYMHNLHNLDSLKFINKKIQDITFDELDNDISGIFHLAAQASVPISINDFYNSSSNNLLATLKVWEIAKNNNIPVVYASSSAVYGNLPFGDDTANEFDIMCPYAQDKLTMEDYARLCWGLYQTSSLGLRFFNVYGPRQDATNAYSGVISIFIDKLLKDEDITVNGGYQTRDFIFVEDIVNVINESMIKLSNNKICDTINVGTGVSISVNKLLDNLSSLTNKKPTVIYKDLPKGDPDRSMGRYEKFDEIINLKRNLFSNLNTGLEKTINFFKNFK